MEPLTLYSTGTLHADLAARTLTGLLLPYGEEGRTNLGRLTIPRGVLNAAASDLPFHDGHRGPIVGHFTHEDTDEGLRLVAQLFPGPAGDAILANPRAVSVEVDPISVRGGVALSGVLTGAAAVEQGAFPSAKLAAEDDPVVPDQGDAPVPDHPAVVIDGAELPDVDTVEVAPEQITITTRPAAPDNPEAAGLAAALNTQEEHMTGTAAPVVQNAAHLGRTDPPTNTNALYAALAGGFKRGLTGQRLEAALSDIIPGDILGVEQPQYVGELWSGTPYERRFVPLFNSAPLNSFNINGWQFRDGKTPEVDAYTGDKADIPSGDVETEAVQGVLQRFAGGHDIDRKFRDFSNAEFWAAYFRKLTESYAKKSDRWVRDQAKAIPTAANGGRVHLLNAALPAGVPKALAMVTKGALKLLNSDLEVMPTFAMITASYFEELMYVPKQQVLEYLSATLGLTGGEVSGFKIVPVPDGSLTVGGWVGQVLVGHKSAMTTYELPGSPIRVEAEAISKGGIDEALFGYIGQLTETAKGFVAYDAPTAA